VLESAILLDAKLSKLARGDANKRKILLTILLANFGVFFSDFNHLEAKIERHSVLKLASLELATGVIPAY